MIAMICQTGLEYPLISRAFMLNNAAIKDRGSLGGHISAIVSIKLSNRTYKDYCNCSKGEQSFPL